MPFFSRLSLALSSAVLLAATLASPTLAAPNRTQLREQRYERKRGEAVADTALQYVGYPYAWGGSSPASGFDCSGFVMFVYSTIGQDLPHEQWGQLASGRQIDLDQLLPGDLLIFQNTYRAGPSHSGVYLCDGQFVHAADERHGVTISSMENGYWAAHYYGASRPGR